MSCCAHRMAVLRPFQGFRRANVVYPSRLPHAKPGYRPLSTRVTTDTPNLTKRTTASPWILYPGTVLLLAGAGYVAYESYQPFRHALLAVVRCSRIARTCPG